MCMSSTDLCGEKASSFGLVVAKHKGWGLVNLIASPVDHLTNNLLTVMDRWHFAMAY